ncbi:MAG TPA: RcnB family protein [Sphingobium sp.]|uniref:RcnB family protein n=1 Tax=Sphingobium sp. TaxID=1912891 RepID=UPI002ED4AB2D
MRKLVLVGLAAGLGGLAIPAAQANDAGSAALATSTLAQASTGDVARTTDYRSGTQRSTGHRGAWGSRVNGRWAAGGNAPGGWNGYYRPVPGWSLPNYWINPNFYISDWQGYGLPAPAAGYGWSRYYDDAVLTDRYGRVADARYGYDWDRYGGYDEGYDAPPPLAYDGYRDDRRDSTGATIGGALVGGVIGGVAGNAIAGRGDKTAGTIIGAGVGALAGGAIGNAAAKPKRPRNSDYRYGTASPDGGYVYGRPTSGSRHRAATYDGRWDGTWYDSEGHAYSGTYEGRFQGDARGNYYNQGAAYAPPVAQPYAAAPVPIYGYPAGGYPAGGYSYGAEYIGPTFVTTTVTTEETTYAARRASAARVVHKARPKPRITCCSCGC